MEKIDSKTALLAFQAITEKGTKADEGYELDGLRATSDIDGYTVQLTDGQVTVHVMFHHSLKVDSPNGKATENFLRRVEALLRKYD